MFKPFWKIVVSYESRSRVQKLRMTTKLSEFHEFTKHMLNSLINRWIDFHVHSGYFVIPFSMLSVFLNDLIHLLYYNSLDRIINLSFFGCKYNILVDPFALFKVQNRFSIFVKCVFFPSDHKVFQRLLDQYHRLVWLYKSFFDICFEEAMVFIT